MTIPSLFFWTRNLDHAVTFYIQSQNLEHACARARGCRAVLQKRADCWSEYGMIYFSGQNRSIPRAHACRARPARGDAGDGDLHLMMEWRPSCSHGRGGQRTPYLRQTSSGCGCRCPGRCRTCPASKYDATGALEHLQLLLLLYLSFALRMP